MDLKILAGDLIGPKAEFNAGGFGFFEEHDYGKPDVQYYMSDVKKIEEITEANKVRVLGAAGWGLLDTLVAGPIGLVAGAVLGGRGKTVVFSVEFNDGKKSLFETDAKTWKRILAAGF
ncbi:MAG: hypothetical protein F4X69_15935 [Gemmatimonadetes bacterium]|nr:hypothetical protein [Gemmatimonadota bacterium]